MLGCPIETWPGQMIAMIIACGFSALSYVMHNINGAHIRQDVFASGKLQGMQDNNEPLCCEVAAVQIYIITKLTIDIILFALVLTQANLFAMYLVGAVIGTFLSFLYYWPKPRGVQQEYLYANNFRGGVNGMV
jgi:hypothetical protein